eukprot:scaffold259468_cov16-Prasinocladus_malaysianus.AAC.4
MPPLTARGCIARSLQNPSSTFAALRNRARSPIIEDERHRGEGKPVDLQEFVSRPLETCCIARILPTNSAFENSPLSWHAARSESNVFSDSVCCSLESAH